MKSSPAFATPAAATTFTSSRAAVTASRPGLRVSAPRARPSVSMSWWNPFAPKEDQNAQPESSFMSPQAGDPGYKAKTPDAPEKVAPEKVAQKFPVNAGSAVTAVKRGFELFKEDFLKEAPERVGVGRQDQEGLTMKPVAGEPGYKAPSIATVYVSELGISPFPDDKNFVSNVGGIEAVRQAAIDSKAGKSAKQIKKEALQSLNKTESVVDKVVERSAPLASASAAAAPMPVQMPAPADDLLPSYLKPIPEDTTRKGMTWKNYVGR